MFYALLFLWLMACVICSGLTHLRQKLLSTSCPCVAVGGVAAATILYISGAQITSIILLAVTLYFWVILRWSIHKQKSISIEA